MRERNRNNSDFSNREGFHEVSERGDRSDRNDQPRSSYDDGMSRSEKNDYRTPGSTYGSRGSQYESGSSYSGSDYDYNRSGYRGDSSGFSGQNRAPYGGQQANRADSDRTQYGHDYSTRRALEDREIGVNSNSPSRRADYENYGSEFRDSGSGFSSNEGGWPQRGQHFGKGPKGYRRSDDRVKEDVCEALERHHDIDASEIEVDVSEGLVTLSGSVESRQVKRMVEDVVEGLAGVSDVKNELRVSASNEAQRSKMMSSFDSTKTDSMDYGRASAATGGVSPARSTSSSPSPSSPSGKSVQ